MQDFHKQILLKIIKEFLEKRDQASGKRTWTPASLVYEIEQFLIREKIINEKP